MATADCGFPDAPGDIRRTLLIEVGPTIPVAIGFDPGYDEFVDARPALPPDLYPALVDPGANGNSIDEELASGLRLPVIFYDVEISGSVGMHTVNIYLAQIYIPALEFTIYGQLGGVGLSEGGQPYSALLGRSFLRHFTMTYDGPTGLVTLSR